MLRRVVITGLGVLACNGIGKEDFWNACVAGRSGIKRITRFDASALPAQIAGEITNFDPEVLGLTPIQCHLTDRNTQLALATANLALQDAGLLDTLSDEQPKEIGVYMGSAMASSEEAQWLWAEMTKPGSHAPGDTTSELPSLT